MQNMLQNFSLGSPFDLCVKFSKSNLCSKWEEALVSWKFVAAVAATAIMAVATAAVLFPTTA